MLGKFFSCLAPELQRASKPEPASGRGGKPTENLRTAEKWKEAAVAKVESAQARNKHVIPVHVPAVSSFEFTWTTSIGGGPTNQPLPVQDGSPGRGTPRQHLPPSRVGGADRPKGRESRRTRARDCRTLLLRHRKRSYLDFMADIKQPLKLTLQRLFSR